jgi:hypothetical protein
MDKAINLPLESAPSTPASAPIIEDLTTALQRLGITTQTGERLLDVLPFAHGDVTAGSETELQVAVEGRRSDVDLSRSIEESTYFENLLRRARSGDSSDRPVQELEQFLSGNKSNIWENSGVRFPYARLSPYAQEILHHDLRADKMDPHSGRRSDSDRYLINSDSDSTVRVPISYLIKLALADVVGRQEGLPTQVRQTGQKLMGHYLNDNTSPETFSFHIVPINSDAGMGKALARETAKRFLLTSLLVSYANKRFGLCDSGQKAMIYFAPHPPQRQKVLNDIIPDSFYRELFMSPCLSGWQKGEQKHRYMHLCHQVLSRSQINAVAKLREAGIITNNLVVLPTLSNTSLANNGTHISLGSRRLSRHMENPTSEFSTRHEKTLGDLAIKIAEHFLPLFVGTYSAAPYRLGFSDFHPEKALGFLPHELDYTHLRMLWRRWRKKAELSVFGRSITPFGPEWLDHGLSKIFKLRGDFVPDFRLLDYPVCFLSTDRSPAFNGQIGNHDRLRADLTNMGISDEQMSLYLFLKPREFGVMGFSGVEGRHYSLFEDFSRDIGYATSLQVLIMALAYKLIASGKVTHADIPDDPVTESERRQVFFGTAINLPTFFVHKNSRNRFLQKLTETTQRSRGSKRYPGYMRIYNLEYRYALLRFLQEEAADLIADFHMGYAMEDLKLRLEFPGECSAAGKLTRGILKKLGTKNAMNVPAEQFNRAAEDYYRQDLKKKHFQEALDYLERDLQRLDQAAGLGDITIRQTLDYTLQGGSASNFLKNIKQDLITDSLDADTHQTLINLLIFSIHRDQRRSDRVLASQGVTP